jgi:hypothetical protein
MAQGAMFCTHITEQEDLYDQVVVDDKVFYKKKAVESNQQQTQKDGATPKRQKRYSDQFKDPVFIEKETIRRLKMIMNFKEKNGDLDNIIARWRNCIIECVYVLSTEYEISPIPIFNEFQLKKHGFSHEDFGIDVEDDTSRDEQD